jgi:endonuclease/exonuclease/phosphatase family metal-dependent hydrolase
MKGVSTRERTNAQADHRGSRWASAAAGVSLLLRDRRGADNLVQALILVAVGLVAVAGFRALGSANNEGAKCAARALETLAPGACRDGEAAPASVSPPPAAPQSGGGDTGSRSAAAATTSLSADPVLNCSDFAKAEGARPTRPDGSQRQRTTVGQFNMYGNKGHHGDPGLDDENGVVPAIVRSVNDRNPTFVSLNEACQSQTSALEQQLGGRYKVYFAPITRYDAEGNVGGVTCDDGSAYGNAVLYRTDFADDVQGTPYDLGTPHYDHERGNERRGAACVSSASKGTTFCAAHLTAEEGDEGDDARDAETRALRDNLDRDFPDNTTLIGGDFNATPDADAMNNIYDSRYGGDADGRFKEVDSTGGFGLLDGCRAGDNTHGGVGDRHALGDKIDYIFTTPDVEIHDAGPSHSPVSDHAPLWSDVTF